MGLQWSVYVQGRREEVKERGGWMGRRMGGGRKEEDESYERRERKGNGEA